MEQTKEASWGEKLSHAIAFFPPYTLYLTGFLFVGLVSFLVWYFFLRGDNTEKNTSTKSGEDGGTLEVPEQQGEEDELSYAEILGILFGTLFLAIGAGYLGTRAAEHFFRDETHTTEGADLSELPERLVTVPVPGDGLCFYHSVVRAVDNDATKEDALKLAEKISTEAQKSGNVTEDAAMKIREQGGFVQEMGNIKKTIRDDAEYLGKWVNHLRYEGVPVPPKGYPDASTLAYFVANEYGRTVRIFEDQYDKAKNKVFEPLRKKAGAGEIRILFKGGNHFEPVAVPK